MILAGIDPGYSGAIAVLDTERNKLCGLYDIPLTTGGELDGFEMLRLLGLVTPAKVVMEKVGARPGNSVVSVFSFGYICGGIDSVLRLQGLPLEFVRPQTWKAEVLRDTKREKQDAINWATDNHPEGELIKYGCRKPSHDRAEAICIAEYGRRKFV